MDTNQISRWGEFAFRMLVCLIIFQMIIVLHLHEKKINDLESSHIDLLYFYPESDGNPEWKNE